MLGNYGVEEAERSREVRRLVSKQQDIQVLKNEFDAKVRVATQALLGKGGRLPGRRANLYWDAGICANVPRKSASLVKNYEIKESLVTC